MFTLNFGRERGGLFDFSDLSELSGFAANEYHNWTRWEDQSFGTSDDGGDVDGALPLGIISRSWESFAPPSVSRRDDGTSVTDRSIELALNKRQLFTFNSPVGVALRAILSEYGIKDFLEVHREFVQRPVRSGGAPINKAYLDFLNILNMGKYKDTYFESYFSEHVSDLRSCREMTKKLIEEIRGVKVSFSEERGEISKNIEDIEGMRLQFSQDLADRMSQYEKKIVVLDDLFLRKMELFDAEVDNLKDAVSEKVKINSAATLWKGRYRYYSKLSRGNMSKVVKCGAYGFAGLLVLWAAVYLMSGFIFGVQGDAEPNSKIIISGRLVFTSVISLIYLTMYLWIVRLLVRNYVSSEHLKIDALSRSSMTTTYLSLVKDGAMSSEEDRSIVLASLFRPVLDGLINDDGPPAVSLPAILNNLASGKR